MARKTVKFHRACKIKRSLGDLKVDFWKMNVITAFGRKCKYRSILIKIIIQIRRY